MIAAVALLPLVVGSPSSSDAVMQLLDEGRFAEAEAQARRRGDTSDQAEVWFRAGLFERVLELPPEAVERASAPLNFLHRRAAAALRVGGDEQAGDAITELDRRLSVASLATTDERAAWNQEVTAFRDALDERVTRRSQIASSLLRARTTVLALSVGFLLAFALGLGRRR